MKMNECQGDKYTSNNIASHVNLLVGLSWVPNLVTGYFTPVGWYPSRTRHTPTTNKTN